MKLKRFQSEILILYIISSLSSVFIASGILLLCKNVLELNIMFSLFVACLIWLYLLMAFGVKLMRAALRPTNSMYEALEHLAEGSSDSAPPEPEAYGISKEIVTQVIKDVYELSSGQHDRQAKLVAGKEFYEAILSLQNSAILTIDRNKRISFANKKAIELLPKTSENPVGMTLEQAYGLEFSSGKPFSEWVSENQKDKIQERYVWERVRIAKSDDTTRYFDLVADYNKNESHGIETVVVLVDKTESYHGDDEQVGFVSLAVHELRSPISLLRGYIEVFEDELANALDDDQRLFMQKMSVAAGQLSTFVNNILNVARIESDQLKVHINRKLSYKLADGIGTVGLDRVAFYEVLSNLIDNAIKYSKEGGEIEVCAKPREGGGTTITIKDEGIGIPSSSMDNLFERFYRSHHSRDQVSGTGLGLFLSKRIVEAHGGTIWVESKEGEGSTFGFDLPSFESIKGTSEETNTEAEENIVRSAHGWIKNHGKVRK